MRWLWVVAIIVGSSLSSVSFAQDANNPDALKKDLAKALEQLKDAQDRKNELATENEKLKAQIASMQKEVDDARRDSTKRAEITYALRTQHAAWMVFLDHYPKLKAEWDLFLEAGPVIPLNELPTWQEESNAPTKQPSTAPATTKAN